MSPGIPGELIVPLANGSVIRSGWIDHADPDALPGGDYLAVDNAQGDQLFYIDSADLFANPIDGRRILYSMLQACQGQQLTPNG